MGLWEVCVIRRKSHQQSLESFLSLPGELQASLHPHGGPWWTRGLLLSLALELVASSFIGSEGCLKGGFASSGRDLEVRCCHATPPPSCLLCPPQSKTSGMTASLRLQPLWGVRDALYLLGCWWFSWPLVGYPAFSACLGKEDDSPHMAVPATAPPSCAPAEVLDGLPT